MKLYDYTIKLFSLHIHLKLLRLHAQDKTRFASIIMYATYDSEHTKYADANNHNDHILPLSYHLAPLITRFYCTVLFLEHHIVNASSQNQQTTSITIVSGANDASTGWHIFCRLILVTSFCWHSLSCHSQSFTLDSFMLSHIGKRLTKSL
jgi:hypothetical protein